MQFFENSLAILFGYGIARALDCLGIPTLVFGWLRELFPPGE